MGKVISHYFCIADMGFGKTNITDLVYYSGKFINADDKWKGIDELPEMTSVLIELRLAAMVKKSQVKYLHYAEFEERHQPLLGLGYIINKKGSLLMLYSQNRIELFDIDFLRVKPMELYQCLIDGKLNNEILNLRSSAVFVCAEQFFENPL